MYNNRNYFLNKKDLRLNRSCEKKKKFIVEVNSV